MKEAKSKKLYRLLSVALGLLVFMGALLISCMIADAVVERSARETPSYAKADISALADKEEDWTDEEIDTLYRQTGLGKTALLKMKSERVYENEQLTPLSERLQPFQDALFYTGKMEHERVADISNRDLMKNFFAPVAPVLEPGDIFVNSSTHTLGFRNGHAAIVLNEYGDAVESLEFGVKSAVSKRKDQWFSKSSNFMILRLKNVDAATREQIVLEAEKNLLGVRYSLAVGIFSKKDQGTHMRHTHCSHLVWQAYKNAGYDIDYNGGLVVTPRDIARSPLFEIIQVYGFDPDKLW